MKLDHRLFSVHRICALVVLATLSADAWNSSDKSNSGPSPSANSTASSAGWEGLLENKQYFALRAALENEKAKNIPDHLFYEAVVNSKFNQLNEAEQKLKAYISRKPSPARLRKAYDYLGEVYTKQQRYSLALEQYETILQKLSNGLTARDAADYKKAADLLKPLANVAPMRLAPGTSGEATVTLSREGLIAGGVKINGRPAAFGFDTGAGFSICGNSVAIALGLSPIESSVTIGTINEKGVGAQFRLADSLEIDGSTLHNVIFLIVPDEAMKIAELDGVVGFPVATAFHRFKIHYGQPHGSTSATRPQDNFVIDGLNPLVSGSYAGREMVFTVDSGASHTDLYPRFYTVTKGLSGHFTGIQMQKSVGLGGTSDVQVRRLKSGTLSVAGREVNLTDVPVWLKSRNAESAKFDGNLGHDVLMQLGTVVFDFETMSLGFE